MRPQRPINEEAKESLKELLKKLKQRPTFNVFNVYGYVQHSECLQIK
ncbi:MAG: hypothetical protein SVW57_07395 [Thermodesulfobacteriota bacterium]|nr:hypothetical protein [Thermodesulfobacteriota bacterium]